ncbi:MAG: DUF3990 domain-containing protein [Bacteroidales bacterium]|nr:DUF3990 domain-containing protein [Bacteroidales bacterium]
MILYHGTNVDFDEIDLSKSKINKDFGQGFYLTADRHQAERLALQRTLTDGGLPCVLKFWFDDKIAYQDSGLKILTFEEYSHEWALFINRNRNTKFSTKQHDYDIVYGPIADDKVGLQIKLFNQEIIDVNTLMERLKFVVPSFQYYFGTDKAIKYLKRI